MDSYRSKPHWMTTPNVGERSRLRRRWKWHMHTAAGAGALRGSSGHRSFWLEVTDMVSHSVCMKKKEKKEWMLVLIHGHIGPGVPSSSCVLLIDCFFSKTTSLCSLVTFNHLQCSHSSACCSHSDSETCPIDRNMGRRTSSLHLYVSV